MARTALTPVAITQAGIDPTALDSNAELTDGNMFPWADHRLLFVLNGDDASLTVTLPTPVTVGRGALAIADTDIIIPAGGYRIAGPFGSEHRQSDGSVHVNYVGTTPTNITVLVLDA